MRHQVHAAVYIILRQQGKVLLMQRSQTGWFDGWYDFPAGHLEAGETLLEGCIREAHEETGISLRESDVKLVHVMHAIRSGDREYIRCFFEAHTWSGEPRINEPDKCDAMGWFSPEDLPQNTIPYIVRALREMRSGTLYSQERE